MRNLKRVLTILAAVMLVAAMTVCASAAGTKFTDVNEKDEALYKAVTLLEGLGITKGTSDTTFGTNEDVTREQMAAFVYRLMKAGKSLEGGENNTPFEDLYDDTFYGMVSWASNQGIIKGISATEFNPDGGITLQDAYTMLVRALGYEKDTALGYPYDYINIAEAKGVTLGKGLPSKVGYTTELSRGNVAVLLYNAFYADMAEKEKIQKERLIGSGDNAKYVLETVEEAPKLCEKIYNVIEEKFQVVETTHYAFNESATSNDYKPTEDSAGEGTMLLVAVEEDQNVDSFYTTLEALGLSGKSDNYIMSELTVFYKYDENEEVVSEVLFAESHLDMQSATAASYGSKEATGIRGDSDTYYYPSEPSWPRMDGSMVVAGKQLYFYDAPYKFLSPSYNGCTSEADRYDVRNADNTKLVELKCLDTEKGLYTYYVTNDAFVPNDADAKLAAKFNQIRTGGIYKIDIFDPDGDGRYEYMWYKPASFAKIIMDEDYYYSDYNGVVKEEVATTDANALKVVPVIYGNGAVISGVAFNDEDFVVAYVSPEANYIDVFGVAQAKKGFVTSYNSPTGTVTLGNQSFRTCYQFLYVKEFYAYDNNTSATQSSGSANTSIFGFFTSAKCLGAEVIMYTYNHGSNNLMYYEIAGGTSSEYAGENLLIPLEAETEATRNDKFELQQYLKVLIGGEEKYVCVDVEECYPAPKKTAQGTYKFDNVLTDENGKKYNVYLNKLCTYEVDKNGNYVIKSLFHGKNEKDKWDHIDLVFDKDKFLDEKKTAQAGNDLGVVNNNEEVILKYRSERYAILDANDPSYSMLGTYGDDDGTDLWFDDAYVDGETMFMIREITDDDNDGEYESEVKTYTGLTFPGSTDPATPLSNVQYIYENVGTSAKRAKLVLFYGEIYGKLEFESGVSRTGYRIVKSVTPVKVDENDYRYSYDLLNISTGELEEGILGTTTRKKASDIMSVEAPVLGAIVELTDGGKVDEKEEYEDVINVDTNQKLLKFTDVVLKDGTIEAEPIREADYGAFKDADGTLFSIYELDEEVEVTLLTFGKKNDFETVEISKLDLEALGEGKKEIKAFNSKYVDPEDEDGKITTEYAEFIKAYVVYSKKTKDEFPVIESIVVIVNDGEDAALLDIED